MFKTTPFDELAKSLLATLPFNVQNIEKDIQQKFKEVLQLAFSQMDLVTREEFDVQCKVLARTREKVEMLERQVDELIALHKEPTPNI